MIGPDAILAAIDAHRSAYAAWEAMKSEATLRPDDPANLQLSQADDLMRALEKTRPSTLTGLVAFVTYLADYAERDGDPTTQHPALTIIAATCKDLLPAGDA